MTFLLVIVLFRFFVFTTGDNTQGLWVHEHIGFVTEWYFDYQNPDRYSYVSSGVGVVACLDLQQNNNQQIKWRQVLEDQKIHAFLYNTNLKYLLTLSNGRTLRKWNVRDGSLLWENEQYIKNRQNAMELESEAKVQIIDDDIIFLSNKNILQVYDDRNSLIFERGLFDDDQNQNQNQHNYKKHINELYINEKYILVVTFSIDSIIFSQFMRATGSLTKREGFKHECSLASAYDTPEHFEILSFDHNSLVVFYQCKNDITPFYAFSITLQLQNTFQFTPLSISFDKQQKLSFSQWSIKSSDNLNPNAFVLIANKKDTYSVNINLVSHSIKLQSQSQSQTQSSLTHYDALNTQWLQLTNSNSNGNNGNNGNTRDSHSRGAIANYWQSEFSNQDLIAIVSQDYSLCLLELQLEDYDYDYDYKIRWCREESLAYPKSVAFFDETQIFDQFEDEKLADEYLHKFPNFFQRLNIINQLKAINILHWVPFLSDWVDQTFEKIITILSENGKLFGLLSTDGSILWSLNLNLNLNLDEVYSIVDMVVLRQHPPHLIVIMNNVNNMNNVVNDSSKLVSISSPFHDKQNLPHVNIEYFNFSVASILVTPWVFESEDNHRILLLIDSEDNVHLYNPHSNNNNIISQFVDDNLDKIYFQTASLSRQVMNGYALRSRSRSHSRSSKHGHKTANLLWRKSFENSNEILINVEYSLQSQLVVNAIYQTGERGALYKYLNPHLIAFATIEEKHSSLHVYLMDGITGRLLLHTFHDETNLQSPRVTMLIYENKFVYSFFNTLTLSTQVLVHDLWSTDPQTLPTKERTAADGYVTPRNPLGASNSFSSYNASLPFITSQAYNFPFVIERFLGVTQTKYSVCNKWILLQLKSGSVMQLDTNFVNSRRPITSDVTAANKMEKLVNYRKMLPYNSLWVLSQQYYMNTISKLKSISTPIESTSLIFGYGIDMFFRRITPSSNFDTIPTDFDFSMLFLILGGVVMAIFVADKWAANKKLKKQWK